MGVQTISGVEWCLAARARVWVPLTARSPPLAKTVCVPMMTCRETSHSICSGTPTIKKKKKTPVKYLIDTRHDGKNGCIGNHGCLDVGFGEAGGHLVSLRGEKPCSSQLSNNNNNCINHKTVAAESRLESIETGTRPGLHKPCKNCSEAQNRARIF